MVDEVWHFNTDHRNQELAERAAETKGPGKRPFRGGAGRRLCEERKQEVVRGQKGDEGEHSPIGQRERNLAEMIG